MAQMIVRNVPDHIKERLRARARANGRSLEAEVRDILARVPEVVGEPDEVPPQHGIGTWLAERFRSRPIPDDCWDEFEVNLRRVRRSARARKVDVGK